jgi:hypothetical protein
MVLHVDGCTGCRHDLFLREGELCPPGMTLPLSALVMVVVMVLRCDQETRKELPKEKVKLIYIILCVKIGTVRHTQQFHIKIILKCILRKYIFGNVNWNEHFQGHVQ